MSGRVSRTTRKDSALSTMRSTSARSSTMTASTTAYTATSSGVTTLANAGSASSSVTPSSAEPTRPHRDACTAVRPRTAWRSAAMPLSAAPACSVRSMAALARGHQSTSPYAVAAPTAYLCLV